MTRNKRDLTFATVNLCNLQLAGARMYPASDPYDDEAYAAKIAWTAAALKRLDADVVAFQELWSPHALEEAFAAAGLADRYRLAFIKEGGWDGVAVACAVRQPWEIRGRARHKAFPPGLRLKKRKRSMADIQDDPPEADLAEESPSGEAFLPSHEDDAIEVTIEEFARSVLQVSVGHAEAPEVPVVEVFCAHLKSRLPTRLDDAEYENDAIRPHATALGAALSTIRRTAEAAALRVILNGVMKGTDAPVVVLGDLNDGTLSNTLNILSDQPSYRVYADTWAARRNDDGLYGAAIMQSLRDLGTNPPTYVHKNIGELIDHVFVSEQFYEYSDRRYWAFHEMRIWNDHLEDDDPATGDHGLVRVAFDWWPAS
jgi:endonuclease/exonuclease/phosphatase family metal-dependent hydrolase